MIVIQLFHEYCICDLTRYKENKIAMRWQTEKEVKDGKGQFKCAAKKCEENEHLRTWEVNFSYQESDERKNALVKVRLCPDHSYKLNYHHKKKDVTKRKAHQRRNNKNKSVKDKHRKRDHSSDSSISDSDDAEKRLKVKLSEDKKEVELEKKASEIWSAPIQVEQEKSREEDFSEYLEDLFL